MLHLALIGTTEWVLIAFVLLLLFGAKKLPDLARSMGSSVNEFKKGMAEGAKEDPTRVTDVRSTSSTPSANGPTSTRIDH
jgi:sec-independent protein translocase protein TatA